jgi:hypothetical protein
MSRDHYPASPLAHAPRTYSKHMSPNRHLLFCDVTAYTENTASSSVACWTVFTELLPSNAFTKSVTILTSARTAHTKRRLKSWSFINLHSRHTLQFTLASVPYWLIWIHEKNQTSQYLTKSHARSTRNRQDGKRCSQPTKQRFIRRLSVFNPLPPLFKRPKKLCSRNWVVCNVHNFSFVTHFKRRIWWRFIPALIINLINLLSDSCLYFVFIYLQFTYFSYICWY